MRKCYLHIGLEKTGTSSIQSSLVEYGDQLSLHGLKYDTVGLDSEKVENNFELAVAFFDIDEANTVGLTSLNISKKSQLRHFSDAKIHQLELLLTNSNEDFIFSSEHFSSRLSSKGVAKLAHLLRKYFSRIEIICFIRPQWETAASAISTRIKSGQSSLSFKNGIRKEHKFFNFNLLLDPWEKEFGKNSIHIVEFSENLLDDFYSLLRLPIKPATAQKNKRLSVSKLKLLSKLNQHLNSVDPDGLFRGNLNAALQMADEANAQYDYSSLVNSVEIFDELISENRAFAARYNLSDGTAILQPPKLSTNSYDEVEFNMEELYETFAFLWCFAQRDYLQFQCDHYFEKAVSAYKSGDFPKTESLTKKVLKLSKFSHPKARELLEMSLKKQEKKWTNDIF